MKDFKNDSTATLSRFARDKRERTVSTERVERRPRLQREADGADQPQSRRASFNPNFTQDNRPVGADAPRRSYGDKPYGEKRYGDKPYGERKNADRPYGEKRYGDKPYGEKRYGDKPYGERKNADRPYGEKRYGDKPYGEKRYGDKPYGERKYADKPYGEKHYGDKPYGEKKYGDKPYGERKNADRPYGEKRYGDKPYGEKRYADKPYSERSQSDRPYGEKRYADKPFGEKRYAEKPYGEKQPADRPYGERTQGEKPYGERKFGGRPASRTGAPARGGFKRDFRRDDKPKNYPKYDPNKQTGEIRLNRFIAQSGICSRREADDFITAGLVSVNGAVVTELGTKVKPDDEVKFNDSRVQGEKKVYLVLNKPKGYVTSLEDPHADKTVMDLVKNACTERIYPVGRLDKNSLGLLLFTNDGDLTKQLTHPSYMKKKIYQVTLDKPLTRADMDAVAEGITLEDGDIHADEISYVKENKKEVGIEIHSGRNRIVRRIFEHLGYSVQKLDRVYYAGLTKKNLKRGGWRFLSNDEVNRLKSGQYE